MTTPLFDVIAAEIADNGPMPIDRFMAMALTHPDHGYYIKQMPFGAQGDFITAPEISQMFGELIGIWAFDQISQQGCLDEAGLVELGPGRGTLMADILRTIAPIAPEKAWPITLMEISPYLRDIQQKSLSGQNITHCDDLTSLPKRPMIFIANEFFDALPIRQFSRNKGAWHERHIDHKNGELILSKYADQTTVALPDAEDGTTAEVSPALPGIVAQIAHHISKYGGAALIIDYGKDNPIGDSLQAVRDHKPVDVLDNPGEADLSAWVDFSAISAAATSAGAAVLGPVPQGEFLKALGLYQRAEQLSLTANPQQKRKLAAAVDRLSSPAQMGHVFKVMAILPHKNNQAMDGAAEISAPGFAFPKGAK